ncbi:MAG: response regulator [Candidatus Nomurabacteria bacterium]|nr:response regulator [Candidatus Nomurabacteria bacterium]
MSENNLKKILIAEDEIMYSKPLSLKLQNAGFEVKVAINGEEALNFIKGEHFDLLLSDIVMPKMTGFELLEEIQKQDLKIPAIVLSNLGQAEDEKRARLLGIKEFLIKSNVSLVDVVNKVKSFLNQNT